MKTQPYSVIKHLGCCPECGAKEDYQSIKSQRDELLKALKNADKLISQLMPGIKHIALQDYAFLNNTLMANTAAIAKATGGQP